MDPRRLLELCQQLQPQLIEWRRDFHQHPELAFKEIRSSERIAQVLRTLGYEPITGLAETGLIAPIAGQRPNPRVLLRFDMDALPIEEATHAEYASKNAGVMHACGHDGHMAIGMGVATILRQIEADLPGSAVLLFQPAEEGQGGARRMLEEGVLDKVAADYALGFHIWNEKPLGWLGLTPGPCMAGSDSFTITLSGKGGHGAQPHLAHDPILAAAHLVTALQAIVSRNVDPLQAAVLSITQIQGGDAFNVIPAEVRLHGTIRTFSTDIRNKILEEMQRISEHQAQSFQCHANVQIQDITPPLVNASGLAKRLVDRFRDLLPDAVIDDAHRVMGSEDMAYFLAQIPGCYFFVGSANSERGLNAAHHNPRFDFDEAVLSRAVYLCVQATLNLMEVT
ncbi:MAG: amidohydrolase [Anaerolineales bacterium]|nr:MAG: amidohydrolase [Anaerolineales bacterium]